MNIVSKVTVKHLRENKKRTFVTILGIILSVALIMAISAFAESFLDMMRQAEIAQEGEWHARFYDVSPDKIAKITEDSRVKASLISREMGNAILPGAKNDRKPYIMVEAYNDTAMEEYPTTLSEGRYPENGGELVVSEAMRDDGGIDWKIGDKVTLELGTRWGTAGDGEKMEYPDYYGYEKDETLEELHTEEYTIVGIIERPVFESYNQAGYIALTRLETEKLPADAEVNVAVQMKKLDNSIFQWGDEKAAELEVTNGFNTGLLSFSMLSGNNTLVKMLNRVKWVMMLIVAAGSVAVIYSSFAISISERSRYLGMLASVGATRKQKRDSVFTEALILGAVGIPLGLLLGYAGVFVVTRCIRGLVAGMVGIEGVSMRVIVSWPGIAGAVILAAVTIFVSAWIPAARAARITPVEAIRQNKDIKLSARQVKTSRLTGKLFGFEGGLALKNLKRNKKRYRATVLSLIFCIALYLSVSSFTAYLKGAYQMAIGAASAKVPDMMVTVYSGAEGEADADTVAEEVCALPHITEAVTYVQGGWNFYPDDPACFDPEVETEMADESGREEAGKIRKTYPFQLSIIGMDAQSLEKYAELSGADKGLLSKGGAILVDRRMEIKNGKRSWKNIWNLKKGDTLSGELVYWAEGENGENEEQFYGLSVPVAAVTEEIPLGGSYGDNINTLSLYTTLENAIALQEQIDGGTEYFYRSVAITTDNDAALMDDLDELKKSNNISVYSLKEEMETMNNTLLLINVFVYGFIILTALICVTSIFNTISTSMALRRREYAMLQSVGMDPKRFSRMIAYESFFYGFKALLWGLPIGILLMYGIYRSIASAIETGFYILWNQVVIAIVSVLFVVGITMWYSAGKIKKANIVETLKDENI